MPRGTKRPKSKKSTKSFRPDSRFAALTGSQEKLREAFAAQVRKDLGGLLGAENLRRLRTDQMIFTPVGRGLVAHASFKRRRALTLENLRRHAPIIGVQMNTLPLIDPVTLTALEPGVYAVRLRPVGKTRFAFDYLSDKDFPVLSMDAVPKAQQQGDAGVPVDLLDIDFEWPTGDTVPDDSFRPPGADGILCLSFLIWRHCWRWNWPELPWPFDIL